MELVFNVPCSSNIAETKGPSPIAKTEAYNRTKHGIDAHL